MKRRLTERIWLRLRSAQTQPNGWASDTLETLSEEFTNLILKQKGNFYHLKLREKTAC